MSTPTATLPSVEGRAAQPRPSSAPPSAGGLTLPVLALAALVCSPAIWQCLVRHTVPMQVMLERYVLIALGCLLVSEVVRRLLWPPAPAIPPSPPSHTGPTTSTDPVAAAVSSGGAQG